jgi:4'-phosphopantetheinyl transferase
MIQLFYTHRKIHSETFVREIFSKHYALFPAQLLRTENGKPYFENAPHFSVTHTGDLLLVAVSAFPVGVDTEDTQKKRNYTSILRRFTPAEREEITDNSSFLRHWTAKESFIKFIGGKIMSALPELVILKNTVYYQNEKQNVLLTGGILEERYVFSVCLESGKEDNYTVTFLP